MFRRAHHLRIASVLQALDGALLARRHCLFGGGTAIVLSCGEYRESADLDFLVSEAGDYRALRLLLTEPSGLKGLVREGQPLKAVREVRADQYGIRTMVESGGAQIKLEIVFESRIALDAPGPGDALCGVATLTRVDLAASKLLANSDRWADDAVFSRDLIDLAMLAARSEVRAAALAKARGAYGAAIDRDLLRSMDQLRRRRGRLEQCMRALGMDSTPSAVVWERLRPWRKVAQAARP